MVAAQWLRTLTLRHPIGVGTAAAALVPLHFLSVAVTARPAPPSSPGRDLLPTPAPALREGWAAWYLLSFLEVWPESQPHFASFPLYGPEAVPNLSEPDFTSKP